MLYKDEFGDLIEDEWENFIDKYISGKLEIEDYRLVRFASFAISILCSDIVPSLICAENNEEVNLEDPTAFEKSCASVLEANGWEVRHIGSTGDQGADIIAAKPDQSMVVQCKLWSGMVGNTAVQEVHAAKAFFRVNKAVVVTNSGYTKAARQLAQSIDILLLHYTELSAL